jgi:hypothetical protein
VQLFDELFCLVHLPGAKNNQQPTTVQLWDTFDEENALWDHNDAAVQGLHLQAPENVDTDPVYQVWKRFRAWLEFYLQPDDVGVLVAWNDKTCNLT